MKTTNLLLHCGAAKVERDWLALMTAPRPTDTWFPIPHERLIREVETALYRAGNRGLTLADLTPQQLHWYETEWMLRKEAQPTRQEADETLIAGLKAYRVRAELATLRPTQRAGLLRYWQTSQMPGSPVYLLGCIHEITSRRVCFWHKLAQRRRLQLIGAGKLPSPWKPQPPHPWDSGKRGPIGTKKAGVPVLLCPHCEAAFYCRPDRDRCPSCGRSPASIPAAPSPTLL